MIRFILNIVFCRANSHLQWMTKQVFLMMLLLIPAQAVQTAGINKNFDHFETNFILNGAHARAKCATCHNHGLFKGTTTLCSGCHDGSSNIAVSKIPPTHIKSNESCDNCHTENRWTGARVDHASIDAACYGCHNNRSAIGKSSRHVASTNICDDCHRTFAWRPARFTHDNISEPCANCHNTIKARGKSANHIQTVASCDACHSTRGWRPAKFVHDNIVSNCNQCHGINATGIPKTGHVQTTSSCEVCHTTRAWRPATFTHDAVTGPCSSCHTNGGVATAPSSGHFSATQQCDICHTNRAWRPARYNHTGLYPDHGTRLVCKNCHKGNSSTIQWLDKSLSPDCGGCHRDKYVANKHENLNVVGLKDCSGTCHKPKPQHSARDSGWNK